MYVFRTLVCMIIVRRRCDHGDEITHLHVRLKSEVRLGPRLAINIIYSQLLSQANDSAFPGYCNDRCTNIPLTLHHDKGHRHTDSLDRPSTVLGP